MKAKYKHNDEKGRVVYDYLLCEDEFLLHIANRYHEYIDEDGEVAEVDNENEIEDFIESRNSIVRGKFHLKCKEFEKLGYEQEYKIVD